MSANRMAKARRFTVENNYRVTDFFSQQPIPSCRAPPSSAPVLTTTTKQLGKQSLEHRKATLSQTQPSAHSQSKLCTASHSSPLRSVKKENAPPPPTFPPPSSRMRAPPPPDRDVAYVSSSSDAQSHISISSASLHSIDSSIVEVVPPVRQDRRQLQAFDISASAPLPLRTRSSPRLQASTNRANCVGNRNVASPRKRTRKRKKPEGVQSDDGEVIDLDAMEEVIIVSTKPARIDLVTPEPSVRSRPSGSRKRTCLNPTPPPDMSSDPVEVIPSSQSDERELNMPKKSHKNLREITQSVREWQLSSSQTNVPPDSSDPFDGNDDDFSMDLEYPQSSPGPRDRSATPVSSSRTTKVSPQTTPRKNSPARSSASVSASQKLAVSVGSERINFSMVNKSPSPMLVSSASSLTKVGTPAKLSSPKKSATPRSSPVKTYDKSRTVTPCKSSPTKEGTAMDLDILLLNQNEKTEAIVERIKAEARARALAMPDEDSIVLGSLDDSDSELGSPPNLFSGFAKEARLRKAAENQSNSKKSGALDDEYSSPLTDIDEVEDQMSRRRITRKTGLRSPSPSGSLSGATRTRRVPNKRPTTITTFTNAQPRKKADPFAKLLKERARRDKFAKIIASPELEDDVNLPDAAEGFATGASRSGSQLCRENSDEGDFETVVRKADSRKLFGEGDNGVVGKILENDRKDRGKDKAAKPGVPFWEAPSGEGKQLDFSTAGLPPLEIDLEDPCLEVLREFVASADVDAAAAILQSSLLTFENASFMEWLFEASICTSGALASSAHNTLEQICESRSQQGRAVTISITPVLRAISKLGARRDILDALHLEVLLCNRVVLPGVLRSEALWRLSETVRVLASGDLLDVEDVPVHFGLLVAIGMDINTDVNLRLSIKHTLNTLIDTYCGEFSEERGELELEICSKVVALTPNLNPGNKEHLLSFIDGDKPIARRIGQWVAFAMLTGDYGSRLAREFVAGPPSLTDVIALLDTRSDTVLRSELFKLSRNSEHFDSFNYSALGHHVEVLGRVLMNIPQYALAERAETSATQDSENSPRPSSKKLTKLEIIKGQLERLGNNIADTRAAHLDRSHTKAVIQQLAMRIDYQRKVARERPKIKNFFGSKST